MLSLDKDQALDRIGEGLRRVGAGVLVAIDIRSLCDVERSYGGEAHQQTLDNLVKLVREIAHEIADGTEVYATAERGGDTILALLLRDRADRSFYAEQLPTLAGELSAEITRRGRQAVYPYYRETLILPVGLSALLHNPNVKADRQVREAYDAARFDATLEADLRARENGRQLLHLILSGELGVIFEPIVSLRESEVIGYEALVRGPRDSDLASPRQLFQLASQTGLVYELDCLCRRAALEHVHCLPPAKKLFLNCLPTSIGDPNLRGEGLIKTLENYNLQPSDLVLEISENESIQNFAIFREMRDSWRNLGIGIAVDDAGAGYASLEAIMEITPDYLKADMGLVRGIDADPPRQEVLRALNNVARRIGAHVIAEGVETEAELRVLRQLGIPYGQGYHFGPGLPSRTEPVGPASNLELAGLGDPA
jgi:EAL domain-containing protein (putative c-di-GMP-specific phosphodiesterase class I)